MNKKKLWAAGLAISTLGASFGGNAARADDDGQGNGHEGEREGYTFAVIGDIPYGDAQLANFPRVVDQINADADVKFVIHLGDIKSGSSQCTDAYFTTIRSNFDRFIDPLIYTPGDNEWTDCHRANNGAFNPLERLTKIRSTFFPQAGVTLGQKPMRVKSQAKLGLPENVSFDRADVSFAVAHIVGSNNSLAPWTGKTAPTAEQLAEVQSRTAADLKLIKDTFAHAREERSKAVVLSIQADMFDPTVPNPVFADWSGFQTIVKTIAQESARFGKPVILFNGDSHVENSDHPLATGSSWMSFYGVTTPAPNLTRVTVEGSTGVNEWIKVTIDDEDPNVISWEIIPFS